MAENKIEISIEEASLKVHDKAIDALRKATKDLATERKARRLEINVLQNQVSTLSQVIDSLQTQIDELNGRIN